MAKYLKKMNKKEIGKVLKLIRYENAISTYDLQKLGIQHIQYKRVENGVANYTIDTLIDYCTAVGAKIIVKSKTTKK